MCLGTQQLREESAGGSKVHEKVVRRARLIGEAILVDQVRLGRRVLGCFRWRASHRRDLRSWFICFCRDFQQMRLWSDLRRRFRLQLSFGIFSERWNRGFELSSDALRRIDSLGGGIGFDIYASLEDGEDAAEHGATAEWPHVS